MFCRFPEMIFLLTEGVAVTWCRTLTPSDCACRPGALRPWVLSPVVGAGWGLGAGVVKTCVFPELCKLLEDRTLPRLPVLPLRSPPAKVSAAVNKQQHKRKRRFLFLLDSNLAFSPASGLRSTQMSSLVLLCCPKVGEPWGLSSAVLEPVSCTHTFTETHTRVHTLLLLLLSEDSREKASLPQTH